VKHHYNKALDFMDFYLWLCTGIIAKIETNHRNEL